MNIRNSILLRVRIAFILVVIFAITVAFKIGDIQIAEGAQWRKMAEESGLQYRKVKATRGNILSDNGSLLATSIPFYKVAFDPSIPSDQLFGDQIDSLSLMLATYFGDRSKEEYKRRITDARVSGRRYIVLNRKQINYQEKKEITNWPIFREGRMKGGVIFEKVDERFNPFNYLADRTIGYVNADNVGAGLEYSFNADLAGKDGKALYQKVSGGNWKPVYDGTEVRPEDGVDLETTIDVNLQDVVEDALLRALEKHRADYGTAVVMEVQSGEIKAISNLGRTKSGNYAELYNYAVGSHGLREPGSTFKLVTMLSLLEETNLQLSDSIEVGDGRYKFYDRVVRDHGDEGLGTVTVQTAFEKSSNVAMAKLAEKYFALKPHLFYNHIVDLKLTEPMGFQMVGEGEPKVPSPDDWSGVTLPWMSHGYGLELTPLHTLTLYNAVANNGVMIKPIIVKSKTRADKRIDTYETRIINKKIASKETLTELRSILEGVVDNGTATNIKTDHYKIAGKTGTAQTLKNGRYTKDYNTSFVGYFPAEKPLYSIIVVIENPKGFFQYGNNVAAPVFKEVSDKIYSGNIAMHEAMATDIEPPSGIFPVIRSGNVDDLQLICNDLGISNHTTTEGAWVKSRIKNNSIEWRENKVGNNLVPDVKGMSLRDALFVLENQGLRVKFSGKGRVKKQSLLPGSRIVNGNWVNLELG